MELPPLILASASPRRQELLRELVRDFQVYPAHAEELQHEQLTGRELSLINAHRKARLVAKHFPDYLVLSADTVVCLGARTFGKPANRAEAFEMLSALAGHTHQVITGVCLAWWRGHQERLFAELTDVIFRSLPPTQIADYLARINPLDKAGAYAIQEHGEALIENLTGSYSNVVGLPLERLRAELANFGAA